MDNFYSESPLWYEKVGRIHALLERVKISEEQHGDILRLRKLNRIMSVHASAAIEGNRLTLDQVRDVVNGVPVFGPPKDIREVRNAWLAYDRLDTFDPWSVDGLLRAHALMTDGLIDESGAFRSVGVAVVSGDGAILHRGAPPASVPALVAELFAWGAESPAHPLIKSAAVHFMLEYIHPFRDGNGRIGRLWQTLILSKWNPLLAWMPVETSVHYNQALYYKALQDSDASDGRPDCRPFIDCMLDIIENSMYKFIDVASETASVTRETRPLAPGGYEAGAGVNVGATSDFEENVGVNVGVNAVFEENVGANAYSVGNVGVNVGLIPYSEENVGVKTAILDRLKIDPTLSAAELGKVVGKSGRTVERHIRELREQGRLVRVGSDKSGRWEVLPVKPDRTSRVNPQSVSATKP